MSNEIIRSKKYTSTRYKYIHVVFYTKEEYKDRLYQSFCLTLSDFNYDSGHVYFPISHVVDKDLLSSDEWIDYIVGGSVSSFDLVGFNTVNLIKASIAKAIFTKTKS